MTPEPAWAAFLFAHHLGRILALLGIAVPL